LMSPRSSPLGFRTSVPISLESRTSPIAFA
jgi:hypothetical protein